MRFPDESEEPGRRPSLEPTNGPMSLRRSRPLPGFRMGARVSNLRPLACEAWRSSGSQAPKYLRIRQISHASACPALGLVRPNTAGFGPTNGPTASSTDDIVRRCADAVTIEPAAVDRHQVVHAPVFTYPRVVVQRHRSFVRKSVPRSSRCGAAGASPGRICPCDAAALRLQKSYVRRASGGACASAAARVRPGTDAIRPRGRARPDGAIRITRVNDPRFSGPVDEPCQRRRHG